MWLRGIAVIQEKLGGAVRGAGARVGEGALFLRKPLPSERKSAILLVIRVWSGVSCRE